jgi:HSP20 family protein
MEDVMQDTPPATDPRRTPARPGTEHPFAALQREMNRTFADVLGRFGGLGGLGEEPARTDVVERDGAVEVSIELPGMKEDDIELTAHDDRLVVRGEKRVEREDERRGVHLSERGYGSLARTVALPEGVDASRAEARFENGVLTVTVPRTEQARNAGRRVEITKG